MRLLFSSQNAGKIKEIAALFPSGISLLSLPDFSITDDLAETGQTLIENALLKARFAFDKINLPSFADDTGLEIDALGGRPGVFSARYAGEGKDPEANVRKVLDEMKDQPNRTARFKTVIAFVNGKQENFFEGVVEGKILFEKKGNKGFGYDPIFQPEGRLKSFAEMELAEKNKISHRARALEKFIEFLKELN